MAFFVVDVGQLVLMVCVAIIGGSSFVFVGQFVLGVCVDIVGGFFMLLVRAEGRGCGIWVVCVGLFWCFESRVLFVPAASVAVVEVFSCLSCG